MLDEPVCGKCSADASHTAPDEGLGLKEMADFIRELGVPDSLAGFSTLTGDSQPWEKALGGGSDRPRLSIAKSHQPDPNPTYLFDIDAFIAEATSLEALQGLRFTYYPQSHQNLAKPIHIWFHDRRLHLRRHICFGEVMHAQNIEIFIAFPNLPLVKKTFLTEEQHAL